MSLMVACRNCRKMLQSSDAEMIGQLPYCEECYREVSV